MSSDTERLVAGLVELDDAADGYRTAMAYYLGEVGEVFASPKAQRETGGSAGAYKVNMAGAPVNAVTDRLTIHAVVALHPDGAPFPEADQVLQQQIWKLNQLDKQAPRLIRNTGIYGDSYLFVWANRGEGARKPVTVAYNSPLSVRVLYDPEDDSTPVYAVKRWDGADGGDYANLILGGHPGDEPEVIRYVRDPRGKWQDPGAWAEVARDGHDFGRLPVEHFANGLPYGRPEHKDAYGAQNAVTKLAPTMVDSNETIGYPARYILTDPDASLRGDRPDSLDFDDDEDQDLTTGTLPSRLRVGPGEIATLEGVREAGQWEAATSDTFIDGANWFMRASAQSTTTPLHIVDPSGAAISGDSRRIADAPLEVKVKLRRGLYGAGLSAALEMGLQALGFDAIVRVKWAPSPVADDTVTWQVAAAKIAAGVPAQVALAETGLYDEETVAAWFRDDRPELELGHRIGLLADLAGAVTQLGQGVALGVIDEGQARAVVERTIGQIMPPDDAAQPVPGGDVDISTSRAAQVKARADALGALVRAGVKPEQAAAQVGLDLGPDAFVDGVYPVTLHEPKQRPAAAAGEAP